jgi:hypothetical protein
MFEDQQCSREIFWVSGVRQGDPISPQLFNIIGDSLARMFKKAHELFNLCLVAHLIPFGVVILQYVDDTIIMFK